MNLYTNLMSLTLIISGLTDLVNRFKLGATLTILFAVSSWLLVFSRGKLPKTALNVSCLVLFILLDLIIWLWYLPTNSLPTINATQNISVFVSFIGFIILSTVQSYRTFDPPEYMSNALTRGIQLSVVLYGTSIIISGPGSSTIMGARSFAMFAIIGLAWFLARWRYRMSGGLFWVTCTIIAIAFSFSRTALVIALILFPLSQISLTSVKGWLRMGLTILLIVTLSYLAFTYVEPIRSRFTEVGDNAFVGGVQINTSGRNVAWAIAYESAMQSPLIGKGPGSVAIILVKSVGSAFSHPHNDYLRIFHDYGLIGLALWVFGYGGLIIKSCQNWQWADRNDQANAYIHLGAFVALIAVALAMTSDNVVVYIFSMNPLGILVGASLGSASRRKKDIKYARQFDQVSGLEKFAT